MPVEGITEIGASEKKKTTKNKKQKTNKKKRKKRKEKEKKKGETKKLRFSQIRSRGPLLARSTLYNYST